MAKRDAVGGNSDGQRKLLETIQEMESLDSEIAQAKAKQKEAMASAEAEGLDKAAIKQILKDRKSDTEKTTRVRVQVERYRKMLGDFASTELGEWASMYNAALQAARKSRAPKALGEDEQKLN